MTMESPLGRLSRILEPEVMDSPEEALAYDAMDHGAVNRAFVADFLQFYLTAAPTLPADVLDLGTGTAQIPIQLCRCLPQVRVVATDLAVAMLDLARIHIEVAGLRERIGLQQVDAKRLPFSDEEFDIVMCNSLVHHLPDPLPLFTEAIRVLRPGGWVFFRDLIRPATFAELQALVQQYAQQESVEARRMFQDSLHAAFTLDELRTWLMPLAPWTELHATSDRHWTWSGHRPATSKVMGGP